METTIIILTVINITIVAILIFRVGTVLLNRIDNLSNLSNSLKHNLSNLDTAAQLRGSDTDDILIKMIKHLDSILAIIQTLSENVDSIVPDIEDLTTKQSATNIALDNLTKDIDEINSRTYNTAADILDQYKVILDNKDFLSTHNKSLEAIIKSTIINNRKLDDVIDFINDFQAAAKDLASQASKASDEEPTFVGGVIKPRSIKEDKDDRIADNDSDTVKVKEEKWLTNEFLDNLEYVDTPNPKASCGNCVLLSVCDDLGLMDKAAKDEDVRIRTWDIVGRCQDVNGYYIKKDK